MMKTEKPQTPLDFFDLENDENLTDHAPLMTQELKCNSSEMFSKQNPFAPNTAVMNSENEIHKNGKAVSKLHKEIERTREKDFQNQNFPLTEKQKAFLKQKQELIHKGKKYMPGVIKQNSGIMMEGHQNMEEELKQDKYKSSSNESDESEDNIAERMNQFDAQFQEMEIKPLEGMPKDFKTRNMEVINSGGRHTLSEIQEQFKKLPVAIFSQNAGKERKKSEDIEVMKDCYKAPYCPRMGEDKKKTVKIDYLTLLQSEKSIHRLKDLMMQPIPKDAGVVRTVIKRFKNGFKNRLYPKYELYLADSSHLLITAKKRAIKRTANYLITLSHDQLNRSAPGFLGKLRSNFLGTEFNLYDQGQNPKKKKSVGTHREIHSSVLYESNLFQKKGPRKMVALIPKIRYDERVLCKPESEKDGLIQRYKDGEKEDMQVIKNKEPKFSTKYNAFVLNFGGRVKLPSVKNFILINESNPTENLVLFGRVDKHEFNLDFQYPISPFQAFSFALSSLVFKWGCE